MSRATARTVLSRDGAVDSSSRAGLRRSAGPADHQSLVTEHHPAQRMKPEAHAPPSGASAPIPPPAGREGREHREKRRENSTAVGSSAESSGKPGGEIPRPLGIFRALSLEPGVFPERSYGLTKTTAMSRACTPQQRPAGASVQRPGVGRAGPRHAITLTGVAPTREQGLPKPPA